MMSGQGASTRSVFSWRLKRLIAYAFVEYATQEVRVPSLFPLRYSTRLQSAQIALEAFSQGVTFMGRSAWGLYLPDV